MQRIFHRQIVFLIHPSQLVCEIFKFQVQGLTYGVSRLSLVLPTINSGGHPALYMSQHYGVHYVQRITKNKDSTIYTKAYYPPALFVTQIKLSIPAKSIQKENHT